MSRERRRIRRAARVERREGRRSARRRRTPEAARQLLLDAAERLFATHNPDEVGLKDVAREAGVSHALITHYFGTYAGLVEATLERRLGALRDRIRERLREAGAVSRPEELLGMLFTALEDPVHLRLMKWAVASEGPGAMHAFALQHRGLSVIAHQLASTIRPEEVSREKALEMVHIIELALVTAVAAATGYAVNKAGLAGAIGQEPNPVLDAGIKKTLAAMLQVYLRERIGLV
jgi:AcrR family transcriptional regulator